MYGCGKDCLILIPFRLPQISCFFFSLKCFSSYSDNCPDVGIGPLLQFSHQLRAGPVLCRPAQPTWAPGSLLVWGEPPTLCEPAGLGSVLQVAQALLTRALRRAGPQLLLKARLAFAGTKTTGSRHGRNTSTTSPRTSGPSWLPGWPSSSSSRCEGLLDFWKGWGLRRQGCSEKGQEGRNWPGSGVWRLGDSPWSPRGVRCW